MSEPDVKPAQIIAHTAASTEDVPVVYANQAQAVIGYHDIRLYFGEVAPTELQILPPGQTMPVTSVTKLRVCLVLSPEFCRSLLVALARSVEQYEGQFGKLRPEPVKTVRIGQVEEIKE